MKYSTEAEARKALESISEPMTIIPDCESDGTPIYRIGTWDEYRRAIDEVGEFLFENTPEYKGEDPDDLMDTYGFTAEFAKDVCESIQELLKEKKEKTWRAIVSYMDDDIREDVHLDMAPCSNEEFLREYLRRDPGFAEILRTEFNMEV